MINNNDMYCIDEWLNKDEYILHDIKALSIITKPRGTENNRRTKRHCSELKMQPDTVQNKGTINRIGSQKNVGNLR